MRNRNRSAQNPTSIVKSVFKQNRHMWAHAFHLRPTPLPWRKATAAGLSIGVPFFFGAVIGQPLWGLLACIGGFTAIYASDAPAPRRALKLLLVWLALTLAFGLGNVCAISPWAIALALGVVGALAVFICAAFHVPPPGGFFFIMACAVGTGLPPSIQAAPERMAFACAGGAFAWSMGMLWGRTNHAGTHQALAVRHVLQQALLPHSSARWAATRMGIALFVAVLVAFALGNNRPYWVPVACAAVLQGANFTLHIHRAIQRAIGTSIGIFMAGTILLIHPPAIAMAIILCGLQWVVELLIVRNYGLAAIFITPLGILIAEAGRIGLPPSQLVSARLMDNLLGIAIGLAAAILLWRQRASTAR